MDDSRAIRRIAAAETRDDTLAIARAFFRGQGFHALSYVRPSHKDPGRAEVESFGFPEAWTALYDEELNRIDPFPALVARAGRPIRFGEISAARPVNADHLLFLERAREHGVTDGFIFPTFGPRQHLAAVGISMVDHPDRIDHADIPIYHSVAQALHLRIDQLEQGDFERPHLAPREVTILHWIARGKSNEEIALILGNKRPTIATHIKRIFAKLDVTDRASAAVQGLKYGIISV
ncbi:autoinducer binding domain-containing protein [Qipengyuania sp.]|uniref:helix-turn-helix transcriptional regulator n=1 Tax=Qipengyuania sp. TaxID=2004515 RepID=UPI003AF6D35D